MLCMIRIPLFPSLLFFPMFPSVWWRECHCTLRWYKRRREDAVGGEERRGKEREEAVRKNEWGKEKMEEEERRRRRRRKKRRSEWNGVRWWGWWWWGRGGKSVKANEMEWDFNEVYKIKTSMGTKSLKKNFLPNTKTSQENIIMQQTWNEKSSTPDNFQIFVFPV